VRRSAGDRWAKRLSKAASSGEAVAESADDKGGCLWGGGADATRLGGPTCAGGAVAMAGVDLALRPGGAATASTMVRTALPPAVVAAAVLGGPPLVTGSSVAAAPGAGLALLKRPMV